MQLLILESGVEKTAQISQCIRNRVTEIYDIAIVQELILEAEHVIGILARLFLVEL